MDAFSQSLGLALTLVAQADAALWQIVSLSLRVSGTAVVLGSLTCVASWRWWTMRV